MLTTLRILAWAYLVAQPANVAQTDATLTVRRGVWPRPVYLTSTRVMPPPGQRIVVLQCVGAGWARIETEVPPQGGE